MENRNSSPCLRNSFKSKSRLSLSQIIYRSSSVSLEIPNFRYIVLFWVLTVQTDLFRLPATSLSASPLQYSFATSSSVGEREIIMRPFPHQKYLSSCQPTFQSASSTQNSNLNRGIIVPFMELYALTGKVRTSPTSISLKAGV